MLPKDFHAKQPIAFIYWEKLAKRNLAITFDNKFKPFFILKSKAIPEPFVVGSN